MFKKKIYHELSIHKKELTNLDFQTVFVFVSSILLLVISWYFANPKLFMEWMENQSSQTSVDYEFLSYAYWFLADSILYFIVPLILIKFILKSEISKFGLSFIKYKSGFLISFISIILFLPIIFTLSTSENFVEYFPLMQSAKDSFTTFIKYEFIFIIFIFSWEFIFRGFLLFGLEKKFGMYSIFIQMMPFVLLHTGKPFLETFASIFGAIFLGYLALQTRSMIYGFLIHAGVLVLLDMLAFLKY